ncbi:hypothetical protein ACMHYO_01625 [Allopusillimonas ginsengisoli]
MLPTIKPAFRSSRPYRGSALLSSCWQRAARVSVAVAFLWLMSGWAMGWW